MAAVTKPLTTAMKTFRDDVFPIEVNISIKIRPSISNTLNLICFPRGKNIYDIEILKIYQNADVRIFQK